MPKGKATPTSPTLSKALKLGDTFTVKELAVPYSTITSLLGAGLIKEAKIREQAGRGRNPKTYALTAKGKKAASK